MKFKYLAIGVFMVMAVATSKLLFKESKAIEKPEDKLFKYKEMGLSYNDEIVDMYNDLSPAERVFTYFIYRASLPGKRILTDQIHRHGLEITSIFEALYENKDKIKLDPKDIEIYLVYLWTNHGQYFQRETSEEKRTPKKLGLNLTKENVKEALTSINSPYKDRIDELAPYIFDANVEPTVTVPGSIEKSANNLYSQDFTSKHYKLLPDEDLSKINAYFYLDGDTPKMEPYQIGGRYSEELTVAASWLTKAYKHAQNHPEYFDTHIVESLKHLVKYLETGDEQLFKEFSKEWLKTDSKIDYNFGFIESYIDPMSYRASFEAEVTIKSMDIKKLNAALPEIEGQLPIPDQFKRENRDFIPNASINTLIFGSGTLGPTKIIAAYCLPNYDEIRSKLGSKQIIYESTKSLGDRLKPALSRKVFNLKERALWLDKVDPDIKFDSDLWNIQCILHETLGHGSGKLATHTFKEGENLTVAKKTYKIGDTIEVTSSNLPDFLSGYDHTLEELRAEILALYISVEHLDTLLEKGFLTNWAKKMSLEKLQEELIMHMAESGLRRYMQQGDNVTKISGDHARANNTIMNYLIDHGGIERSREQVVHEGKSYDVVSLKMKDFSQARSIIKDLMILVQTLKSTGDGLGTKNLIETYGVPLKYPEDMATLKANRKAVSGELKASANIFPIFDEVKNGDKVSDIKASWPKDIFELYTHYKKIELSTN